MTFKQFTIEKLPEGDADVILMGFNMTIKTILFFNFLYNKNVGLLDATFYIIKTLAVSAIIVSL